MAIGGKDRRGLGRGLSALMADVSSEAETTAAHQRLTIPIAQVVPNSDQPRQAFDQTDMDSLAASVREKGIIQPIIVRKRSDELYEIVAGERRWRAAQMVQLHEIPAIVREFSDTEVLEIAIVENIQRADLNPVEEAAGYQKLMAEFGHTQEKLAQALGKSRSYIANLVRLLALPTEVKDMLRDGLLSAGHARALVPLENPVPLAREIVTKGLSVRDAERLAKGGTPPGGKPGASRKATEKDADTRALEADLSTALTASVSITHDPQSGSGTISIRYRDLEHLDDLCQKLSGFG